MKSFDDDDWLAHLLLLLIGLGLVCLLVDGFRHFPKQNNDFGGGQSGGGGAGSSW